MVVSRRTKVLAPEASTAVFLVPTTKTSCFFVVDTADRRHAYRFLSLLRGFYEIFFDLSPWSLEDWNMSIYEFDQMPRLKWSTRDWFVNYRRFDTGTPGNLFEVFIPTLTKAEFTTGNQFFTNGEFDDFAAFVTDRWNDVQLVDVLDDLNLSLQVFDGNMMNAFPDYRFREAPKLLPDEVIDKTYLEFRGKFEMAFLCAFKGLEHFLGVNQITKRNAADLLIANEIDPEAEYRPRFLQFLGREAMATYGECLRHFVDVRNTTAAHSNTNPPRDKRVSVYSIYEIQEYLKSLLLSRVDLGT